MLGLAEITKQVVGNYKLQKWFLSLPSGRPYACDAISFLTEHFTHQASILELGCGIAQNLAVLWDLGFRNLWGIEADPDTFMGAVDLCAELGVDVNLACGDAELVTFRGTFDAILPLNWTYQEGIDISGMLVAWHYVLRPGGVTIIDIIDSDLEPEIAPEYVQRFSASEFEKIVASRYRIIQIKDYFPRHVYYLEKI